MTVQERLTAINEHILQAKHECGRADTVSLMAVSKTHPIEAIEEAYTAGQLLFGENRVQEIIQKFPRSSRPYSLHLIGHLQSNKVKKVLPWVDMIDSVDSIKIATLISEQACLLEKTVPILLEWNTSEEENKSGFVSEKEYYTLLDTVHTLPGIEIRGLMTVGPLTHDEKRVRKAFSQLRERSRISAERYPHLDFSTLSMGMTSDFVWAIYEGSTMVRIGSAIFGNRTYI